MPSAYAVQTSGLVADQFRRAADRAVAEGRLPLFIAAAKWAVSELERTPSEFGESREDLPADRIQLRCGFARPVYVEYGVHEPTRQVHLRKWRLVR